ncbi:MAG TPA: hypothetical protein VGF45_13970, partial [Polyangia bacterium]
PAAARAFEEAHRRAPHAATLYNAGLAWQWANQAARAADDYEAALKLGGLSAQQRKDATDRLANLEPQLGHIRVVAPPDAGVVSVAHVERAPAPLTIHAPPGRHEVKLFRAQGSVETSAVTIAAGQTGEVVFTRMREVAPSTARESVVPPQPTSTLAGRHWAWIALGTSTAALSGAAVYTGISALDARDKYNASARTDVAAYDRATTLRSLTNILWAGTVLVAATGAFFMLSLSGSPPDVATSQGSVIAIGPGGAVFSTSF